MIRFPIPALLLVFALTGGCTKPPARPGQSAIPVSAVTAVQVDLPLTVQATGTVEPIRTVTIQSQVNGLLIRVGFREGEDVRAGQVLFQIDPAPYQTTLDQTSATLARDLAQWEIARRDVNRFEALAVKEYVTQQQLDQARTTATALAATLRADSAAVERARIDLQNATIRSPIDGRTGQILVREGNLVRANGEPLLVVNQIAPVLVRFAVPAQYLEAVRRRAADHMPVHANPANVTDTTQLQTGALNFLDNAVDSLTGTLVLKASFPNHNRLLWPGALVRVTLELETERGVTVIPQAAVQSGQTGDIVWVIDSAGTASPRKVMVTRSTDSLAVIGEGIQPGEEVVTDGQLRLTSGAKVTIRGTSSPADSADRTQS